MAPTPNPADDAEQLMMGAVPGVAALGRGPVPDGDHSRHEYHHPAAGWARRAASARCCCARRSRSRASGRS
ncbi:hypothetical protein ACFQY4_25045 [Catellatospora bangladeshensis]|uniref:hypothetical protein n=1 Tax=Catellatospora bangladeshensis TaxID=310355 RepID=UPI0036089C17